MKLGAAIPAGVYATDSQILFAVDRWAAQHGPPRRYPELFPLWRTLTPAVPRRELGFPSETLLDGLLSRGVKPVIFLETAPSTETYEDGEATILTQAQDFADDAKAWGQHIFVRVDQEMNGTWAPWSGSAATYISRWRAIHDIFETAPRLKMVWCPILHTNANFASASSWFPGTGYVDVMAFDRYDLGQHRPLDKVWRRPVAFLNGLASSKRVFVMEFGTLNEGSGRVRWLRSLKDVRGVSGAIYFDINMSSLGEGVAQVRDWRLNDPMKRKFRDLLVSI